MTSLEVCPDWLEAISAYLDGALANAEEHRVHAHLRQCPGCSKFLVDLVPVVQAVRALPPVAPTRDPWLAIVRELRQDPLYYRRRMLHRLPRPMIGWVAAATLVISGSLVYLSVQHQAVAPVADMDLYYQQHDLYSQEQGVPTLYAPEFSAIQASYQLDP